MRHSKLGLFALVGIVGALGCKAGKSSGSTGLNGGASATGTPGGTMATTGTFSTGSGTGPSTSSGNSCAKFTAQGKQATVAMLFVLARNASMSTSGKWPAAQQAIVAAIDQDAFNSLSLGLVSFPQSYVNPPDCLCKAESLSICSTCADCTAQQITIPQVSCGIGGLPEVAINVAGTMKSNDSSGVRHEVYQFLTSHQPDNDANNGAPIYDAMVAGYDALKLQNTDKRVLILISDGGFSCTSLSSPNRPGYFDGACNDWEYPDTVNALITQQRTDATKPTNTFIVGLPGSNTNGGMTGSWANAPYSMRLALSTYAVSGSPTTVDPTCSSTAMFTKPGSDPAKPCHIDLSAGAFDASKLADAINAIRGQALGCIFALPDPPPGQTIDPNQVNVQVTQSGMTTTVPRRSNPTDMCLNDGCWDYTTDGKVELIGKACSDNTTGVTTKVDIEVGCMTIIK